MTSSKIRNYSDREQISECQGLEVGTGAATKGFCERVSWSNGNVLYPDIGGGYMNQCMC